MRVESMSIPRHGLSKHVKLALMGFSLALGAVVSVLGLNQALHREAGVVILWLGWLTLGLIVGSALCVFSSIAGFLQARKRHVAGTPHKQPERYEGDYLAKYSIGDKTVALGLAAASAALAGFFILGSASGTATTISVVLVLWAGFYLVHVSLTQVLFTNDGVLVRRPFQPQFSERYDDIKRIRGKPGTVKIEFADGRLLKLHSGLGDADIVISFLRRHCPTRLEIA